MKRGFTLIELLTVVGIMALLGTAATGGYAALQRGMAERGAVAVASALLKSAKERAKVDRVPTIVICYNRLIREADDDENAIVVGEAVAIRRAGRISYVQSNYLIDEFADLGNTYDVELNEQKLKNRMGMRLWRFDEGSNPKMAYSVVADAVSLRTINEGQFEEGPDDQSTDNPLVIQAYGFYDLGTSGHKPSAWKSGHAYGLEFATIQLPHDFTFGSGNIPTNLKDVEEVKVLRFEPDSDSNEQIDVYYCRPNASGLPQPDHRAGTATSKENEKS